MAQMVKAKASLKEIAAALGRSVPSVMYHLEQHRDQFGYIAGPKVRRTWHQRKATLVKIIRYRDEDGKYDLTCGIWLEPSRSLTHFD